MSAQSIPATPRRMNGKGDVGRHSYIVDWPTVFLGLGIYAAFLLITWFYHDLPWWVVLPAGASLICLHGSLQHEAVHGYPFRSKRFNRWFAGWPLWLWMPYDFYVKSHLKHHIDEDLTHPRIDPETSYLTLVQWSEMSALHRLIRQVMRTMAGRLLFGPAYYSYRIACRFLKNLRNRDAAKLRPWLWHMATVAIILLWVMWVCGIPFWAYVALFAYPGTSMALLRSYAEHRAMADEKQRSIILEAGPFWSVMFLWNNLHALHHVEPGLAWYRRASRYQELKTELLEANGHYFMPGYWALAKAYLLWPKEPLIHPDLGAA